MMNLLIKRMLALGFHLERRINYALATLLLSGLSACGPAQIPSDINDPNEMANRRVHEFNKSLDRALGGGPGEDASAEGGVEALDDETPAKEAGALLIAVSNFGTNLDTPRKILNSLLQLRPGDAAHNTMRFGINSTIGVFGLFDIAGAGGLPEIDTDFGETMHVWGVGEGSYQELPVIGPSTQRDTVGSVVDFAMNPLWYVFPWPENLLANGFTWAAEATDRIRYGDTVESILYESEDSYAQSRLIYLQNRRFELRRGEVADEDYIDPYEELFGE